jgi:hypothetical protein
MKKLFLVMALLFLSVSIFAAGEGSGTATIRPNAVVMGQANVNFTITVNATGTTPYNSSGKIYVTRPAGFTNFSLGYDGDGGVTVTAVNGSIASWVTDGKTLTITTNSLTAVIGKVIIGWNLVDCPSTGGNYQVTIKTAPQGGAGSSISSFPYVAISGNTPTGTKTNTPVYSPIITPTVTQSRTPTITPTVTQTNTGIFTKTFTRTPTFTVTKTVTKTITKTLVATETATKTVTETVTETVTKTITPTITMTIEASETMTFTVTPQQTQIPVSIGAVVKGKFTEAREKGLLYGFFDRVATGLLDTTKSYEIFTSTYDSYTFKVSMGYTGQVNVYLYELSTGDYSAGGTTITARNGSRDANYAALTANTKCYEDGGYNTDTVVATELWTATLGGGINKEFYAPVDLGSAKHYILIVETKETDNEGALYLEFYGN